MDNTALRSLPNVALRVGEVQVLMQVSKQTWLTNERIQFQKGSGGRALGIFVILTNEIE